MAKYELKTKVTGVDVIEYLKNVENETKYNDALKIIEMMKDITGEEPKMWGPSIIGFGQYRYKYESGQEGTMCRIGFSPRKDSLVLYIGASSAENEDIIQKLGKYKTGKSCLYVKKLNDIDLETLKELIKRGFERKAFAEL